MSFFDTEEFHAVVPAKGSPCGISAVRRNSLQGIPQGKDRGGRSAPQGHPSPPHMDVFTGDGRPPGSSGTSGLEAIATIGRKKRHPYP